MVVFAKRTMRPWTVYLATFGLAFAVRIGGQITYGSYVAPETWEYDVIARGLLSGEGYHYVFYGADWLTFGFPAFPALLAVLHWVGGGPGMYGPILVAMAVASSALVPLGYRLALRLDPRAALIAVVLLTLDPVLILFSARVHELNLDALLLMATLVLALEPANGSKKRNLALGVVIGLSGLARPTVFVFGLIVLAVLFARRPGRSLALGCVIALAIVSPWALRNALVLGAVTGANPYNCVTLWMGNNPSATGGPLTADGRSVFDVMDDDLRARVIGRPEVEQGRAFCDEAYKFLRAEPARAVSWVAQKFGYFWWFPPHAGIFYPDWWLQVYRPIYAVELALAATGLTILLRRKGLAALVLVLAELAVVSLAQSVGYVEGRHRLVLEPTLVVLAAIPLALLAERVIDMRRRQADR